jgi:hypothetical protein
MEKLLTESTCPAFLRRKDHELQACEEHRF